jgi:hypothetical protein
MCAERDRPRHGALSGGLPRRILTLPHIADIEALMLVATIKDEGGRCRYDRLDDTDRALLRLMAQDATRLGRGRAGARLGSASLRRGGACGGWRRRA